MAVSVIEPIITLCEESELYLSQPTYHNEYRFDGDAAREFADEKGWSGFAFVFGVDGPMSAPSDVVVGDVCEHTRDNVNGDAALSIMRDAAGESGVAEWHGYLVYDYGNPLAQMEAESIANAMGDDGYLDTAEYSSRMASLGIDALIRQHHVPEELAEQVAALMPEVSCPDCDSLDPTVAMGKLGYAQCADCPEWIRTGGKPGEVLCYECADRRDCGGECVSVVVDAYRHGGHVVTVTDVDGACDGTCQDSDDE